MTARLAALALSAVLAGCSNYALLQPARIQLSAVHSVDSAITWNRSNRGTSEVWTVDGPLLQSIRFVNGLRDGETLFSAAEVKNTGALPRFGKDMDPFEVVEFLRSTLALSGVINVRADGLRPAPFGDLDGFRFEFALVPENGLRLRGFAVGAVHEERLYMIVFTAAALHYYDAYKDVAERIVASVETRT